MMRGAVSGASKPNQIMMASSGSTFHCSQTNKNNNEWTMTIEVTVCNNPYNLHMWAYWVNAWISSNLRIDQRRALPPLQPGERHGMGRHVAQRINPKTARSLKFGFDGADDKLDSGMMSSIWQHECLCLNPKMDSKEWNGQPN